MFNPKIRKIYFSIYEMMYYGDQRSTFSRKLFVLTKKIYSVPPTSILGHCVLLQSTGNKDWGEKNGTRFFLINSKNIHGTEMYYTSFFALES